MSLGGVRGVQAPCPSTRGSKHKPGTPTQNKNYIILAASPNKAITVPHFMHTYFYLLQSISRFGAPHTPPKFQHLPQRNLVVGQGHALVVAVD